MIGLEIRCERVSRTFEALDGDVIALGETSFDIPAGTAAAIVGPSGCGKSTLMTILGGLQRPSTGRVFIGDTELGELGETELLRLRAESLAVVAQNPYRNLIPYGNAEDNIRFAQRGPRSYGRRDLPDPTLLLKQVGLEKLARTRVDRISGGERQRVALAVALSTRPRVLLADEPTSQLDEKNRDTVVGLLHAINVEFGLTVVVVTHDASVANQLGRSLIIGNEVPIGGSAL
jgi:ABC-type lipoprotein export system ATPase subunit